MARRQSRAEKERNKILGWWGIITLLCLIAWQTGRPELWGLPILAWAYYQLCAAPKLCGVETTRGHPCKFRAYGRLMACTREPSHDVYKRDAFLRLLGFRREPRPITAPASYPRQQGRAPLNLPPMPEPPTVESKQQFFTILTVLLTIIGTVATVIQTVATV
ncbi:MAG: hypothetical protein JWP34_4882 [Massilia sp.]|jgi:hypothetical protein|nr:hypothetical protein [Gemmatimonadales bacterium]MDB5910768.1 hypothetical protein [Massilia sp.]